jgi:hypothetical protein
MSKYPQVSNAIFQWVDDFETVIYFSQHEKTNIRGDLGALEIYHDGSIKIRPDYIFLAFPTSEHL